MEAKMSENRGYEFPGALNNSMMPQPVAIAVPAASTAAPDANKRDHSAIAEDIRREPVERLADSLRPARKSKSPVRGIFERPPHSGVWWISYSDAEGKRHREKIGRRAAAIDAVAGRRLQVKEGRFIPPRAGARLTFRELATAALAQKKILLAPLSYATDLGRLTKLYPLIGNVPADCLTSQRIAETLAHLKASMSGSTVNRYRSAISSVYSFAIRSGKTTTNPVSRVQRFRENDSRLNWLRPDQEKAIREAIDTNRHEAEFSLVLNTGMRRGENWNLAWRDVDLERGKLTVHGKTGRRHIPANSSAKEALRQLQKISGEDEFVCPERNAAKDVTRDWRKWFENAVKKADVKDFHFHDLRHTFASRLVMAGVDIRTVQELLGHKSITVTMKYSHLADDHRKAAVEKMNPAEGRA